MDNNNMNIKQTMQLLGIQEVTTKRQKKNGTREFELPIKDAWTKKKIRIASFASGYVRNQNSASSNYQLNKCEKEISYHALSTGDYRKYVGKTRILIPNEQDRLEYLISYCLKNYYIKRANQVPNGDFYPKWMFENKCNECDRNDGALQNLSVTVNGERYKII